ncbi:MAG: polysaccharide biosynthesis/export family protein [Kiritimatiellia bacterium]
MRRNVSPQSPCFLGALCLWMSFQAATAQQPAGKSPPPAPSPPGVVPPGAALLQRKIVSGDVLSLRVQEQPSLNKDYGVSGDGTINLPEMGRVQVAQFTMEEATRAVKLYLEDHYFKRATVTLSISDFVKGSIFITGGIGSGGGRMEIPYKGDELISLYEAIVQAGGLAPRADRTKVKILRWKPGQGLQRDVVNIDMSPMFDKLDFTNDEYLKPRDIVVVPMVDGNESQEILLLGAVGGMGYHAWTEGMTLLRLLANTGGPSSSASPESARILRPSRGGQYNILPVDINQLFAGNMTFNIPLMPGDIIYVPLASAAKQGQVWLLGQVAKIGPMDLPLRGEMTISQALLNAGWGPFPKKGSVELRRRGADGKKLTLTVDVGRILDTGEFEIDVPLQDGDQIYVPEALFVP